MANLPVANRATIANMTPENGSTIGFFPVDAKTIEYLQLTHRGDRVALIEAYCKAQGMFATGDETPDYTDIIDFDLSTVVPAVAGPARPQDRIPLGALRSRFAEMIGAQSRPDTDPPPPPADAKTPDPGRSEPVAAQGIADRIGNGSIVIAAITSCTNTSNPSVMLGAGLLGPQRGAPRAAGCPAHVKTSLAPGSRVVSDYLEDAGLMPYLEALGFHVAGFGCTTCIGNSGPLHPDIERAIRDRGLTVAAILSGNRNFEARIHQADQAPTSWPRPCSWWPTPWPDG